MDELLTALAGLEGTSSSTVLATPDWALRDDLCTIRALAIQHCMQIDVDKISVLPQAFQLLRKHGYDIKIVREANQVMAVTLYASAGVFVLYHNANMVHSFVNIHKPSAATRKRPVWCSWFIGK